MIRHAADTDIPRLLDMGAEFHKAAKMPFKFNAETMGVMFRNMIENDAACVLISDSGLIGGIAAPAYCDPEYIQAIELFWWAESGGIKLLRAFEEWATNIGVNEIRMTSLASLPRADRLLKKFGYAPAEISYGKVI